MAPVKSRSAPSPAYEFSGTFVTTPLKSVRLREQYRNKAKAPPSSSPIKVANGLITRPSLGKNEDEQISGEASSLSRGLRRLLHGRE